MLRSSRRYRTRVAQLRFAVAGIAACAALAVFSAAVIVARPSHEKVSSQRLASRDIVLCLDVSGSVIGFDSKVSRPGPPTPPTPWLRPSATAGARAAPEWMAVRK